MLTAIARRAEGLITAKVLRDAAGAGLGLGAEVAWWGRIVALRVAGLREVAPYNKARGVNGDDLPYLGGVTAFFTDAGIVPTLEVWAGDAGDRLGVELARRGMYAGVVTATMHLDLDGSRPVERGRAVTVEELDPADDGVEYLAALAGGYGFAGAGPERLAMLRAEHDPAVVRRYLARVDGRPAAAAGLFLDAGGALLSGAATLPEYRRHGCQRALIARRLADAGARADLAVVTVAYGSASQANLEHAGFRQTHTRTAWRPLQRHRPGSSADER